MINQRQKFNKSSGTVKTRKKDPEFASSFAQSVLDGVDDPIMVIDAGYRIIAMNKTARLEHFGNGPLPDDVFCYRVTHHREEPCSGDDHPCPLNEALRTGRTVSAIHSHVTSDGSEIISELSASSVFDEKGVFMYVVETNRDITDRVRAEITLKESEAQLRTVIDSINAGVMLIDPETHVIVDVNLSAEELIGKSREHIIGSVCHGYICPAETGKCPITDLQQTVNLSERQLINSRGEYVPILKSVVSAKLKGRMLLIESFIDITESKKTEEALRDGDETLRNIMETTLDGFMRLDSNGNLLDINTAYCQQSGYTRKELFRPEHLRVGSSGKIRRNNRAPSASHREWP